jgi:beta-glucosidase
MTKTQARSLALVVALAGMTYGAMAQDAGKPACLDPSLPAEQRSADVVQRVTLEEKAAQMVCVWREKAEKPVDANGDFDLQKATVAFIEGHPPGQMGRPSGADPGKNARGMAELTNAIQKFLVENMRLAIPVPSHGECLHGHAAIDGTSFPQPVAPGPGA